MPKTRLTIVDVAAAAGVSVGAVSLALNDRPGVSAATRERILVIVRDLGWAPSHRARALSTSRAMAIGLVVARTPETLAADPFFAAFLAGVETVLSQRRQALLLHVVADRRTEHDSYRRLASDGRVDGVLLIDLHAKDPRPALLAELGLPAIAVGPDPGKPGELIIAMDDRQGIAAAVHHLVELGHRDIAHVAGPRNLVHGRSRRAAWAATLRAAGLPLGPCVHSDFSAAGGAAATTQVLDRNDPPTAIVYANDLMAIAGMSAAMGRGIDVPGELSVTGFDDSPIAAHLQPPLTTVHSDVVGWGAAAARALLDLIDDQPPRPVPLAAPRLIIRASTAPPRSTSSGGRLRATALTSKEK
ncbi:MAG: LacI family DNA-binding transcriptional regulator [Lapillicoccus sp.]